jgi:hypothetical protein
MIKNFEQFSIDAWIESGLTTHVKIKSSASRARERHTTAGALVRTLVSAVSLFISSAQVVCATVQVPPQRIAVSANNSELADSLPFGFWRDAVAELRGWREISAQDIDLPDPQI